MSKIKRDKEQKGKNAVLVIAIGKHPKMGPGPRKVKKAEKRKSKSQMRRERRAAKQAKREASGEEKKDTSEAGREATKKLQMSQRAKRHYERMKQSGDPSDVRDYVERRRINMKDLAEELGISTVDLGRLNVEQGAFQAAIDKLAANEEKSRKDAHQEFMDKINNMSIEEMAANFALTGRDEELTNAQKRKLASLMGVQGTDIRENSPMLEGKKLEMYNAMREMGKDAFERRQSNKQFRQAKREGRRQRKMGAGKHIFHETGIDPKMLERIAMARGMSVEALYNMITGRDGGDEEEMDARGDYREGDIASTRKHPSSVFTTPFPTTQGTGIKETSKKKPEVRGDISGERGSSLRGTGAVEDAMHGFRPPLHSALANVGEYHLQPDQEANYDEVDRTMEQYQRGEPMSVAFQLLKQKHKKKCKNCGSKEECAKMGC